MGISHSFENGGTGRQKGGCMVKIRDYKVNELRKERGWTLQKLAQLSGLSYGTILGLCYGKRNPGIDTLITLAETFGVDVGEWIKQQK